MVTRPRAGRPAHIPHFVKQAVHFTDEALVFLFKLQGNKHVSQEVILKSQRRRSQRRMPAGPAQKPRCRMPPGDQHPLCAGDRTGAVCQGPALVWTAARTPGRPVRLWLKATDLPPQLSAGQPLSEAWRAQASGERRRCRQHPLPPGLRMAPQHLLWEVAQSWQTGSWRTGS